MPQSLYPRSFLDRCQPSEAHLQRLPLRSALTKRTTEECGVGIYARRPFHRGDLIGGFVALEINEVNQHSLQRSPGDYLYDPYFVGYLLHSCDPNVVLDMHQQTVYCVRNIAVGEPLMMDYASTEDTLFKQFPCACGAPNCRHWVSGRAEPINNDGWVFLTGQRRAPAQEGMPAVGN